MLAPPDRFEADVIAAMWSLRSFAINLCRDATRADDLVQETCLKALANRDKFQPGTNLQAWLFTILRNVWHSAFRKTRREVEDPESEIAKQVPFEDDPRRKLEACEVLALLHLLKPEYRDVLMRLADGATYEEIAEEIHEHVGTVKSRVHRGRQMLLGNA